MNNSQLCWCIAAGQSEGLTFGASWSWNSKLVIVSNILHVSEPISFLALHRLFHPQAVLGESTEGDNIDLASANDRNANDRHPGQHTCELLSSSRWCDARLLLCAWLFDTIPFVSRVSA